MTADRQELPRGQVKWAMWIGFRVDGKYFRHHATINQVCLTFASHRHSGNWTSRFECQSADTQLETVNWEFWFPAYCMRTWFNYEECKLDAVVQCRTGKNVLTCRKRVGWRHSSTLRFSMQSSQSAITPRRNPFFISNQCYLCESITYFCCKPYNKSLAIFYNQKSAKCELTIVGADNVAIFYEIETSKMLLALMFLVVKRSNDLIN